MKAHFNFPLLSLIVTLSVFLASPAGLSGQCANINPSDYAALRAFYISTNGDSWTDNTGWDQIIRDPAPGTICDLSRIYGVWFTSDSPPEVFFMNLTDNNLSGILPSELGNLSSMTQLYLGANSIGGSIPTSLGELTNLTHLRFTVNRLTGIIPHQLGEMINLVHLSLDENQLSGPIPAELGNLRSIEWLDLSSNRLNGEIPRSLINLRGLEYLELSSNELTGIIPSWLGVLHNLQRLDLSFNNFSGEIPSTLGLLINLEFLNLRYNNLSGLIPPELGRLADLQYLYLSGNSLLGELPPALGKLSSLNYFDASLNALDGCFHPNLRSLCEAEVILDFSEFDMLWLDFCAGAESTCTCTLICEDEILLEADTCALSPAEVVAAVRQATGCRDLSIVLYVEGVAIDLEEYRGPSLDPCVEMRVVIFFADGSRCYTTVKYDLSYRISSNAAMLMQEYLTGAVPPGTSIHPCLTYGHTDRVLDRSCDLMKIERIWSIGDRCGHSETVRQIIDVIDFQFCRFIDPMDLFAGRLGRIEFLFPIEIPENSIKWTIDSQDWEIVKIEDGGLWVIPGKSSALIKVQIKDVKGRVFEFSQKLVSGNAKKR